MENHTKNKDFLTALLLVIFFPIGLLLMWTRTAWNKKVKWGITALFGLLILVAALSGNSSTTQVNTKTADASISVTPAPTAKPQATPTPQATVTPVPKDSNGFPMDAENVTVANLDKSPRTYQGKKITFTCRVIGFAKDSNGNASAVNCSDVNDSSSLIQVDVSAFDVTKINQDDIVRFYGLGMGSFTGKNAFGGEVAETGVVGMYINDVTSGYKE